MGPRSRVPPRTGHDSTESSKSVPAPVMSTISTMSTIVFISTRVVRSSHVDASRRRARASMRPLVRPPSRLRHATSASDVAETMVTVTMGHDADADADEDADEDAMMRAPMTGKRTWESVDDGDSAASDESDAMTMDCIIAQECERERREGGRRPSGETTEETRPGQRGGAAAAAAAASERELAACEEEIKEYDGRGPTQALYAKKATIEISGGRFVEALESAKKTVEAQPLWFRGYVLLSEAMLGLDQTKKTETRETVRASLERALFLQPNLSRDAAFRELCAEIGPAE